MIAYPQIDFTQAAKFLAALDPSRDRWVFQTFPDQAKTVPQAHTRVTYATLESATPMLQAASQSGSGLFVQINQGRARGAEKITSVTALWLDLDGGAARPLRDIAAILPAPTIVVESSPGKYHLYWRLDAHGLPLGEFRAAQQRLAAALGGDPKISNLDRVMRLPGTWHQKTDTPFLAPLRSARDVSHNAATLLALCSPEALPARLPPGKTSRRKTSLLGALRVAAGKFILPERISQGERTDILIKYAGQLAGQGFSFDAVLAQLREANRLRVDPPLSEEEIQAQIVPGIGRFVAAVTLTSEERARLPKETPPLDDAFFTPPSPAPVYSPLPDERSTCPTLEAAPGEGAKEAPWPDPTPATSGDRPDGKGTASQGRVFLDDFLDRYVYIEESDAVIDRRELPGEARILPLRNWKTMVCNKRIGEDPAYRYWLVHPTRKSVRGVMYHPGEGEFFLYDGALRINNYRPSDLRRPDRADPSQVQVFLDHINYLFSSPEDSARMLDWCAITVQKPSLRVPWTPLLVSLPGAGKGWLYHVFQKILGPHNCAQITSDAYSDHGGQYNDFLSHKLLVCIDEMEANDSKSDTARLKSMITEPEARINRKYGRKGKELVFANFIAFSNSMTAAKIDLDDRRFWVRKITAYPRPPEYYAALFAWLDTPGPAHLLRWLLDRDISHFAWAAPPPVTEGKTEMAQQSLSVAHRVLASLLEEAEGPFAADIVSAAQVKSWVRRRMEEEEGVGVRGLAGLSYAVHRLLQKLPQAQYRIPSQSRARLHAVRNRVYWATATPEAIVAEYLRGVEIELGRGDTQK